MCDTFVALGNSTLNGAVIFAKNSDREANEAAHMQLIPAADYGNGESLKCTYLTISQVAHTNRIFLCRPFWMWGAEMGINEHGVAIGNEAVFTRAPYGREPGMIGMDLLRLGLERANSAYAAMHVIIELMEQFGQSGNCGLTHEFFYHNSFLLADSSSAWVLETVGKQWAAEKVQSVRSISNALSIGEKWDEASADVIHYADDMGWHKKGNPFNFAQVYSDWIFTTFSDAKKRQVCTTDVLNAQKGKITPELLMATLRTHKGENGNWSPDSGLIGADVCMHADYGPVRNSQTASSLVSILEEVQPLSFITGTAAPCTSVFFPFWLDAGLPDLGTIPEAEFDPACLWWQHEQLHRAVLQDYPVRSQIYRQERNELEADLLTGTQELKSTDAHSRFEYSAKAFERVQMARTEWIKKTNATPKIGHNRFYYTRFWKKIDSEAKFPES